MVVLALLYDKYHGLKDQFQITVHHFWEVRAGTSLLTHTIKSREHKCMGLCLLGTSAQLASCTLSQFRAQLNKVVLPVFSVDV